MAGPLIWAGNYAKNLKDHINLNDKTYILTGSADPSASATDAPKGSLYLSTNTGYIYRKTDAGSSTNWVALEDSAGEYSCQAAKTSSQNPGTTAATKTTWDSVASSNGAGDPLGLVDLTNERIVSPLTGTAIIYADLSVANFEAATTLQIWLYKNGAEFKRYDIVSHGVGTTRSVQMVYLDINCATNDYYEIFTSSSADSSYSIIGVVGVSDSRSVFGAHFLS